ncbi:MAG: ribonuclease domain-containing protein [Clostridiaceae bacterium]
MRNIFKKITPIFLTLLMTLGLFGCSTLFEDFSGLGEDSNINYTESSPTQDDLDIEESGSYDDFEGVAEYIKIYNKLPSNFITKKEARSLGWDSGRDLWDYAEGKSIGGDYFGNYEGLLPEKDGRDWYECDINYRGGRRGADRIVFSNDGLIYMTTDHYKSFTEYTN